MEQKIEIWLIRHGKTPENEQHRYIGWLDSSLGSAGKAELIRASETVSKVWVTNRRRTQESGCLDVCPGGESKAVFCSRVCSAFLELTQGWQQKEPQAVYPVVAHGGTQMALLEQFGEPKRSYYEGQTQAGDGWKLVWENERLWIKGQLSFRRQQEKRGKR